MHFLGNGLNPGMDVYLLSSASLTSQSRMTARVSASGNRHRRTIGVLNLPLGIYATLHLDRGGVDKIISDHRKPARPIELDAGPWNTCSCPTKLHEVQQLF